MPPSQDSSKDRAAPSWLISMVLHALLLLLLAFFITEAPRQGAVEERTADVGIVLKHSDSKTEYYETESNSQSHTSGADSAAAKADAPEATLADAISDSPPGDPSEALPKSLAVIGPGTPGGGSDGFGTGRFGGGGGGHSRLGEIGAPARTSVFGIEGEGHKFAFAFDRSSSMGGSWRSVSPLEVSKAELIKGLQSLQSTHQFQIIFYNNEPSRFNPTGTANKLFFATERNKELASRFIRSITPFGGTDHEKALLLAINTQPDVIFFLADADEYTVMSPAALAKIKRRSAGITINTIEFGMGPQPTANSYLVQLARQNGGRYMYVDVRALSSGRR